jgi:hypothetical protein
MRSDRRELAYHDRRALDDGETAGPPRYQPDGGLGGGAVFCEPGSAPPNRTERRLGGLKGAEDVGAVDSREAPAAADTVDAGQSVSREASSSVPGAGDWKIVKSVSKQKSLR